MAEHKHGDMDVSVQTETFNGFVKFVTWTVVFLLALLVFMAIFAT
ncbi:aa3-type cytochrome c oxidase subunit IV [Antarcticimicrobium sediminis]|uniref:Aa3-type cytochrome c oxidase subunit IV n=1 Tax=Antarcticimicrobium sediminis TaxID=2546227 RepID=A0A4R5EY82_9RHOB|nr:aa3-type cytochrome c oxidase subunit IV [Antarcticimicrobium sediminis]MDX2483334.1 aa3-type cytochrome c oxidase subunit IV [Pseudodonghicola sp.]TDE39770.1 aa3-type cytochrome c oxidase subunit IV [Antarcticimicrobium sediminis]